MKLFLKTENQLQDALAGFMLISKKEKDKN